MHLITISGNFKQKVIRKNMKDEANNTEMIVINNFISIFFLASHHTIESFNFMFIFVHFGNF